MKTLIDRLLLVALTLVVLVLAGTAAPTLAGGHLDGTTLLAHMGASGALVIGMPLVALWFLPRSVSRRDSSAIQRCGFWLSVLLSVFVITTVFLCMLPIPSTDQMHQLMGIHGYTGFAMVPAVALFVLGTLRARRIQSQA